MTYSPFHDKTLNQIPFGELEFDHLNQLQQNNILEGYHIQFIKSWNANTKKQIAAVITSFANSGGGWILIGIDKDRELTQIHSKRQNFDKQIEEILKRQTSKKPSCSIRFLENPEQEDNGIIVIYTEEGDEPPYIANGTIFVRNGKPEPILAERSDIEILNQKRITNQIKEEKKLDRFCKNETLPFYDDEPLCCIYLYNKEKTHRMDTKKLEDVKNTFISDKSDFMYGTLAPDSVILNSSAVIRTGVVAPIIEIFSDYSAKIIAPIIRIVPKSNMKLMQNIMMWNPYFEGDKFRLINSHYFYQLISILGKYIEWLYKNEIDTEEFTVIFHLQKINNTILYFDFKDDSFYTYMMKSDLPYSIKTSWKSLKLAIRPANEDSNATLSALLLLFSGFIPAFGYSSSNFWDLMQKHMKSQTNNNKPSSKTGKKQKK